MSCVIASYGSQLQQQQQQLQQQQQQQQLSITECN
jgi:hypothetical protein